MNDTSYSFDVNTSRQINVFLEFLKGNFLINKNMIRKVSVIIPVYNAERFLCECLDSVIAQTFTDFEVILVDDGSTDGSGAICDEYASIDNRVSVIHNNNGGVSAARNVGIERANGKWICFFDADDILFPDALENLIRRTADDVDSVCCGYVTINSNDEEIKQSCNREYEMRIDTNSALKDFIFVQYSDLNNFYLWNRIFRQSVISDNNIRFREDLYIKEDGLFLVQYLCRCRGEHLYSSCPVYKYRINKDGTMASFGAGLNKKSVSGFYARIECFHEIADSNASEELLELCREFIVIRYVGLLYSSVRKCQIKPIYVFKITYALLRNVSILDFIRFFVKRIWRKLNEKKVVD